MSKASRATAAAAAAPPPAPFRPPLIPIDTLLEQANTDSLLPSLVHCTVNSIVHAAIERLYHAGIERAAEQYVAQQAIEDVLSVVQWQLIERDEGEEKWISGWEGMTAADEAERQRHLWVAEDEPLPTTIDRWARHVLPVSASQHEESSSSQQCGVPEAAAASSSDSGAPSDSLSAPLDSTAPFPVLSATTSASTTTSPALHVRSVIGRSTKPHRLPSPSTAKRPRPSSTSSVTSQQPLGLGISSSSSSLPYPLPSSSPLAASEQQRLARMATLKQQQAEIAEKKRRERERIAEEEGRREEERAKERSLMSARRQKAAAVHSVRLTASEPATQPRTRHTQSNPSQDEEKQQIADASLTSSSSSGPTLPALSAARRTVRPAKPKRTNKQAADVSTVDGYTNAAALMASIVRAFVPAAGVRLVYGSEIKAGADVGGSGGEGRGRGVSVEDEQWVSVVRGMNRSQYMRWMDEQRSQAAKEADIQLRQHNTFSAPGSSQPTQPTAGRQQHQRLATEGEEADHNSTTVRPAIRVQPSEREDAEEKVQLTARAAVVLQPRVVTRERRELSFDSRIIADNTWGSNNSAAVRASTRGPAYDVLDKPKSDVAVRERKAVVSVPRKQKVARVMLRTEGESQLSARAGKVRASSAGRVTVAADKSRLAALLQLGKSREVDSDAADADGEH